MIGNAVHLYWSRVLGSVLSLDSEVKLQEACDIVDPYY
jgi:hypothetical protein